MKNNYLFKNVKQLLLLAFLLVGVLGYSQVAKKSAVAVSELKNDILHDANPAVEAAKFKNDMPQAPQNYTVTKVSISKNLSAEAQADFIKKHGADFYYVYTNDKGKAISKEEIEVALEIEQNNKNNNTPNNLITNPKK